MITVKYNPSALEMDLTNALVALQNQIEPHLQNNRITKIEPDLDKENPIITFHLTDTDGDKHEIMIRIFQVPDKY